MLWDPQPTAKDMMPVLQFLSRMYCMCSTANLLWYVVVPAYDVSLNINAQFLNLVEWGLYLIWKKYNNA
jgi:hypothetical protein